MEKEVTINLASCRASVVGRAELIEVIHVSSLIGLGKNDEDPVRTIHEYYSKEGTLLARHDPHKDHWSNVER